MPMEPVWVQWTCAGELQRCPRCGFTRALSDEPAEQRLVACTRCGYCLPASERRSDDHADSTRQPLGVSSTTPK